MLLIFILSQVTIAVLSWLSTHTDLQHHNIHTCSFHAVIEITYIAGLLAFEIHESYFKLYHIAGFFQRISILE